MGFLIAFAGLLFVLLVIWIVWSVVDNADSPWLCCNQSPFNRSILKHCPILQTPYVPTWLWGKSGHIQTILYGKMGRVNSPKLHGFRSFKVLPDGATMSYDVFQPTGDRKEGCTTLLVCPGIANSSESIYIRTFVHHAQRSGFRLAVLNHLGALANVPLTAPRIYTYGGTEEYGVMVDEMMSTYPSSKFVAIGFSMGANIVIKYLGECEDLQTRFTGAISCCQGYDVMEVAPYLLSWSSGRYLYVRAMTEHQKRILRRHQNVLFSEESARCFGSFDVDKILAASTMLELDTHYSHKRAGFKSCEEYYNWCSSRYSIDKVHIPMLLLNAVDDPIVPPELHYIPRQFALSRDNVIFAITKHGGHLGYFEGGTLLPNSVTWLDRVVVEFSSALVHSTCTEAARAAASQAQAHLSTSAEDVPLANGYNTELVIFDDDDDDVAAEKLQKHESDSDSAGVDNVKNETRMEDELASDMVAQVLKVSTSMVYGDDSEQNGLDSLIHSDVTGISVSSPGIKHSMF